MPNNINYATSFQRDLVQKYERELLSSALTTNQVRFIDSKTIRIPFLNVGGYKMHSRAGGFNRQSVENDWMIKTLGFDRNVEFFVDSMDVEESNQAVSAANVTNVFLTEQAIPETDCYRFSKLYSDFVALNGTVDNTAITEANVLSIWDGIQQQMTEANVPEGRIVYATPAVIKALKNATGLSRSLNVGNGGDTAINRTITALDNTTVVEVPSLRMKSAYDFTDGFAPAVGAKQINMIVVAPSAVIACDKHSYIRLWAEGTHTQGDGWLYQNRKYGDLWIVDNRVDGVYINAEE